MANALAVQVPHCLPMNYCFVCSGNGTKCHLSRVVPDELNHLANVHYRITAVYIFSYLCKKVYFARLHSEFLVSCVILLVGFVFLEEPLYLTFTWIFL